MLTNTAATIYNQYTNPVTRDTEWRRTVLDAVHWENNKAVNVLVSGLESIDSTFIMIPFSVDAGGKQYISPKGYAALDPHEVGGYWTLNPMKDRLIKGDVVGDDVVTTLAELSRLYDDLVTVKSVDTADYGSEYMWHWEVSGS